MSTLEETNQEAATEDGVWTQELLTTGDIRGRSLMSTLKVTNKWPALKDKV